MNQGSYGEQTITVNSRVVGTIRALSVGAVGDVFPRLVLKVEVILKDSPSDLSGIESIENFALQALRGELRMQESLDPIGQLTWLGYRGPIRSSPAGGVRRLDLGMTLDRLTLERIEVERNGAPLRPWLVLWPSMFNQSQGWYDAEVAPFRFAIPREDWLAVLEGLHYGTTAILEVPLDGQYLETLKQSAAHLRRAETELRNGRFDEAVSACRLVTDSMYSAIGEQPSTLPTYLASTVGAERAGMYTPLLKALKDICNLPHHATRPLHPVGRIEAALIVQLTQHLLALVGAAGRMGTSRG